MNVVLTMPAFNEADGIETFVRDIYSSFGSRISIIVCDDQSSDETVAKIERLLTEYPTLQIMQNSNNLGHGQTFLRALKNGYLSGAEIIMTCDGDGQFSGKSLHLALEKFLECEAEVLEGVRSSRTDGIIRSIVSLGTRVLSFCLSGSFPKDGNTPLRIYRREKLGELLNLVPEKTIVPNIWFSLIVRMLKTDVFELRVESRQRLGTQTQGTSWQGISNYRKLQKLVNFCLLALNEITRNYRLVYLNCKKI